MFVNNTPISIRKKSKIFAQFFSALSQIRKKKTQKMDWIYSFWLPSNTGPETLQKEHQNQDIESDKEHIQTPCHIEEVPKPMFKLSIADLHHVARTLKKTHTIERCSVPLQFQLITAKKHLQPPKVNVLHIIQPEFVLCKQMLRKTTTKFPETVLELPSPLFLEMMEKYKKRQERLQL